MNSKILLVIGVIHLTATSFAANLPAQFEHDRIRLCITGPNGAPLRFYVDSGGGFNAITQTTRSHLGLPIEGEIEIDDDRYPVVRFPASFSQAGIPAPLSEPLLNGGLAVVPDAVLETDAFLGSRWFAGRIWQIDYPNHAMSLLDSLPASKNVHRIPLAFRTGADGTRSLNFPRITISVDGAPMEVLLDTGATAKLTSSSAPVFKLQDGAEMGVSYVVASTFEKWRKQHPNWRVLENGEGVTGQVYPMIEVPSIRVADMSIGPVWFAERFDDDFHNTMSDVLGVPADGALGGSGLKYFRIILDYPAGNAYFSRPK